MFELCWTPTAAAEFEKLKADPALQKRHKAVAKALRLLAQNPRHPGLNTHAWKGRVCPHGEKLWEAYAENNTPAAYRIFFCYVPGKRQLLVIAITPHP